MLEFAWNFERTAAELAPIVLIGPGLAAVLVGLFVWLGGLGFRRVLVAVVGAVAGGVCGFFITGRNIAFAGLLAIVGVIIAIILEKILVSGSFFWRLAWALCCAVLGTLLIFAGMVLLLLYKGAVPVSYISDRQSFYACVFAAMTAFGTIEQLLFCRHTKREVIRKEQAIRDREQMSEQQRSWRTT